MYRKKTISYSNSSYSQGRSLVHCCKTAASYKFAKHRTFVFILKLRKNFLSALSKFKYLLSVINH